MFGTEREGIFLALTEGKNNRSSKATQNAGRASYRKNYRSNPRANALETKSAARTVKNNNTRRENRKNPVRIIPLGGLNEIGKNMTVFECCNDMFILDCGLAFPEDDMLGIDLVRHCINSRS